MLGIDQDVSLFRGEVPKYRASHYILSLSLGWEFVRGPLADQSSSSLTMMIGYTSAPPDPATVIDNPRDHT